MQLKTSMPSLFGGSKIKMPKVKRPKMPKVGKMPKIKDVFKAKAINTKVFKMKSPKVSVTKVRVVKVKGY